MTAELSEWHSFGDPEEAGPGQAAAPPAAATPREASGGSRPLSSAASHRSAWMAVGITIIATVVGVAVFVTTLVMAGGGQPGQVVIAARNGPSPRASDGPADAGTTPRGTTAPSAIGAGGPQPAKTVGVLVVDVEGAVREPGLHQVPQGSRIGDAIAAAGGYAERADLATAALTLNLAEPLADGVKIRVPVLGDRLTPVMDIAPGHTIAPPTGTGQTDSGPIDLNQADEAALEGLPGIGPVTAGKIIAARQSAPFATLDDLVSRKALSQSVLDKIRSLVTVAP